jgi:hypothetical protein
LHFFCLGAFPHLFKDLLEAAGLLARHFEMFFQGLAKLVGCGLAGHFGQCLDELMFRVV